METNTIEQICVVVGASHGGVNFAFALRKEGWLGKVMLFDADPFLPYHRPPLSKAFLTSENSIESYLLKPEASYEKENIGLHLGEKVVRINREEKYIELESGKTQAYDKLVLATGSRALVPPINGLKEASNVCFLRTASDVLTIKEYFETEETKTVLIIGGGYIGLEIAASLKKLGAAVTILERESRILSRVTAPEMSEYFNELHAEHGVEIFTEKQVVSIKNILNGNEVTCEDDSVFLADLIVVGVGIRVNFELAEAAGLEIENGIKVNEFAQTSDSDIYAIGDCTIHFNKHYNRNVRLESVQNAVDQGKIAASSITGKNIAYDAIPWFWSDQYDVKLQIVGLSDRYNELIIRIDPENQNKRSIWFFKDEELLSVQGVNDAKAYVYGTKLIKEKALISKKLLSNSNEVLDLKLLKLS